LGSPEDAASRREWKYGGAEPHISGTPIFYANGVRIDGAEDWRYGEWLQFFQNYTGKTNTHHSDSTFEMIPDEEIRRGLRMINIEERP